MTEEMQGSKGFFGNLKDMLSNRLADLVGKAGGITEEHGANGLAAEGIREGDVDMVKDGADLMLKKTPGLGSVVKGVEAVGGHNVVDGIIDNFEKVLDGDLSAEERAKAAFRATFDINPATAAFSMVAHAFGIGADKGDDTSPNPNGLNLGRAELTIDMQGEEVPSGTLLAKPPFPGEAHKGKDEIQLS